MFWGTDIVGAFAMKRFDWSNSDGAFKTMVGVQSEKEWAEKCNKNLEELYQKRSTDEDVQKQTPEPVNNTSLDVAQELSAKRKASSVMIDKLTMPSKRKANQPKSKKGPEIILERVQSSRIGTCDTLKLAIVT